MVTEELSRQALYDLVWETPVRTFAPRFKISDVGLRKACQKSHIPLPVACYWAKLAAGEKSAARCFRQARWGCGTSSLPERVAMMPGHTGNWATPSYSARFPSVRSLRLNSTY